MRRVVVTGMGIVSSIGNNTQEVLAGLREGKSGIVRADDYATALLTGGVPIPDVRASGFKDLAQKAVTIEKERGVDASAVVWSWARRTGDYDKATMAAHALDRTRGGTRATPATGARRPP